MKVKSLTGFMLGNERCAHHIGSVWADYDTRVWICPNLAKAEKVLQNSQQNRLEPATMWTTIYQIHAKDIVCEQSGNGLLYTNTPTKIIVDRIVAHHEPRVMTEQELLNNVRSTRQKFMRLLEGLNKEDEK